MMLLGWILPVIAEFLPMHECLNFLTPSPLAHTAVLSETLLLGLKL